MTCSVKSLTILNLIVRWTVLTSKLTNIVTEWHPRSLDNPRIVKITLPNNFLLMVLEFLRQNDLNYKRQTTVTLTKTKSSIQVTCFPSSLLIRMTESIYRLTTTITIVQLISSLLSTYTQLWLISKTVCWEETRNWSNDYSSSTFG